MIEDFGFFSSGFRKEIVINSGQGKTILSCVTYSQVDGAGGYMGAVAGWTEGDISGNYYFDRGLGGVDGVSFTGNTDPFTDEQLAEKTYDQAVLMLEKDIAASTEGTGDFPGSAAYIESIMAEAEEAVEAGAEAESEEAVEAADEAESEEAVEAVVEAVVEEAVEAVAQAGGEEETEAAAEEENAEAEAEETTEAEEETETEETTEAVKETETEETTEAVKETETEETTETVKETETEETTEAVKETETEETTETVKETETDETTEAVKETETEETTETVKETETEETTEAVKETETEETTDTAEETETETEAEPEETTEAVEEEAEPAEESEPAEVSLAADEFEPPEETVVFPEAGAPGTYEDSDVSEDDAASGDDALPEEPEKHSLDELSESSGHAGDPVVTFMLDDDKILTEVTVPFGEGISELPEVENDGDDYWVWDEFEQDAIYSDTTVTGSYHHPVTTLADGNPPRFLVEGIFYDGNELEVTEEEIRDSDDPDDEPDTAYTLKVTNYDKPLKVRMKADYEGTLYQLKDNGDTEELLFTMDGSYLTFDLENGGTFFYEEFDLDKEIHKMPLWEKIAIGSGAAVILLILLLLIHRRRKKRKQKKLEKQQEKKEND